MFKRSTHPGEILKDELEGLDIIPSEFARQIQVPPNRITQILQGRRAITADTALRLGHWFGVEPQFWLNLQDQFDLLLADRAMGEAIQGFPTKEAHMERRANFP